MLFEDPSRPANPKRPSEKKPDAEALAAREEELYRLHSTPRVMEVKANDELLPKIEPARGIAGNASDVPQKEVPYQVIGPLTGKGFEKFLNEKEKFRVVLTGPAGLSEADIDYIKKQISSEEENASDPRRAVLVFNESKLMHVYTGKIEVDAANPVKKPPKLSVSGYMDFNDPQVLLMPGLHSFGSYHKKPPFKATLNEDGLLYVTPAKDIVVKLPELSVAKGDGPRWTKTEANNRERHRIDYSISDAMDLEHYQLIVYPKLEKATQEKMDAYLETLDEAQKKNLRIVPAAGADTQGHTTRSTHPTVMRQLFFGMKEEGKKKISIDLTLDCLGKEQATFEKINPISIGERFEGSGATNKKSAEYFIKGVEQKKLSLLPASSLGEGMDKALAAAKEALADIGNRLAPVNITLADDAGGRYAGAPKPKSKSGSDEEILI